MFSSGQGGPLHMQGRVGTRREVGGPMIRNPEGREGRHATGKLTRQRSQLTITLIGKVN